VLLQEYSGFSSDVPAYVRAQDLRDKIKSLEALVTSEFILRHIIKKFDPTPGRQSEPTDRELEDYRKRITVEQVGTQFVELKLLGGKKEGLGQELSAILAALFESLLSANNTSLDAATFLLRTRRQELRALEARLTSIEASGGDAERFISVQQQTLASATDKLAQLEAVAEQKARALDEALTTRVAQLNLAGSQPGEIVAALRREIAQSQTGGSAPSMQEPARPSARIAELSGLLADAEDLERVFGQIASAKSQQATVRANLKQAGKAALARQEWRYEADDIRKRYGQFEQRLNQPGGAAAIQLLRAPAQIQVIDTPKDPNRPRNSRLLILVGGILGALVISGGLGFLAEQLDGSLRGPDTLRARSRVPVAAVFSSLDIRPAGSPRNHRPPDLDRAALQDST
jgi:hypothetical protein